MDPNPSNNYISNHSCDYRHPSACLQPTLCIPLINRILLPRLRWNKSSYCIFQRTNCAFFPITSICPICTDSGWLVYDKPDYPANKSWKMQNCYAFSHDLFMGGASNNPVELDMEKCMACDYWSNNFVIVTKASCCYIILHNPCPLDRCKHASYSRSFRKSEAWRQEQW